VASTAPGIAAQLKWPNDVLVAGRKLAGILLEADGDALVAGIGVNVASHPDGATSLAREGAAVAVPSLLTGIATAFQGWLERWEVAGFTPVRAAWLHRAVGLGGAVQVRLADQTLSGTFTALDEGGALVLDGGRRILAGDVTLAPGA
ncbi:MAG: biotin--[acetyl-CoA-carboxylase] ligase, partial [Proteobacteria bacterium]|nr:biotin--[acetyl-CoA-carboxylase] ligase [Pseudomonadota bacterium]